MFPRPVRVLAFVASLAFVLAAFSVPVQAGTKTAPEITDPANDQALAGTVPISTQPPAGTTVGLNADLLAGWIDTNTPTSLTFNILVQGTGNPTTSSTTTWTFHFETGGKPYDATAKQDVASPAGSGAITPGGAASGAVSNGDSMIHLTVLKSAIGDPAPGAVFTNLFLTSEGRQGDKVPNGVTDRAPNTGAGTDYVLPGGSASAAPQVVRATLTTPTVTIHQTFTASTSASYVYNWTKGPAKLDLNAQAKPSNGTVAVAVKDHAGREVYNRTFTVAATSTLSIPDAAAGNWTFAIRYTAFAGQFNLTLAPTAAPLVAGTSSTTSSSGPTTASGSQSAISTCQSSGCPTGGKSSSGSTSTKASPSVGLPLVAAAIGLAAIARRIRRAL